MLIYDDIFYWEGWGGKLKLASGRCKLQIYDLNREKTRDILYLRPILIVASDISPNQTSWHEMTVRSCSSHIATKASQKFNIAPQRMMFVEYSPQRTYGEKNQHIIPARYDTIDFIWNKNRATNPTRRPLENRVLAKLKELMKKTL